MEHPLSQFLGTQPIRVVSNSRDTRCSIIGTAHKINIETTDKNPENLVDDCLEVLGCVEIETDTYHKLEEVAAAGLEKSDSPKKVSSDLIIELFKLIVSSREYQRC